MPQDELFRPPDTGFRLDLISVPTTSGEGVTMVEVSVRDYNKRWGMLTSIQLKGVMHDYVGSVLEDLANSYQWGSRRDIYLQARTIRRKLNQHYNRHGRLPSDDTAPTRPSLEKHPF